VRSSRTRDCACLRRRPLFLFDTRHFSCSPCSASHQRWKVKPHHVGRQNPDQSDSVNFVRRNDAPARCVGAAQRLGGSKPCSERLPRGQEWPSASEKHLKMRIKIRCFCELSADRRGRRLGARCQCSEIGRSIAPFAWLRSRTQWCEKIREYTDGERPVVERSAAGHPRSGVLRGDRFPPGSTSRVRFAEKCSTACAA
jgi:hypothetical protein